LLVALIVTATGSFAAARPASESIAGVAQRYAESAPVVASHPAGWFAVGWHGWTPEESNEAFTGWGTFVQLYHPSGRRVGSPFRANETWQGDQTTPHLSISEDGELAVVWTDDSPVGALVPYIFFRAFDSSGEPLSDEVRVPFGIGGVDAKVCSAGDHFVVISKVIISRLWSGDQYALRGERFTPEGYELGDVVSFMSAQPYYTGDGQRIDQTLDSFDAACTPDGFVAVAAAQYDEAVGFETRLSVIDGENAFVANVFVSSPQPTAPSPSVAFDCDRALIHVVYVGDETPEPTSSEARRSVAVESSPSPVILRATYPLGAFGPASTGQVSAASGAGSRTVGTDMVVGRRQNIVVWRQEDPANPSWGRIRAARFTPQQWRPLPWDAFGGSYEVTLNERFEISPSCSNVSVSSPDSQNGFVVSWTAMDPAASTSFPVVRCFDSSGGSRACGLDWDGDGVANADDCDENNPFLLWDLDDDGICEETSPADAADCAAVCSALYPAAEVGESRGKRLELCLANCERTDNCPCRDEKSCPRDSDAADGRSLYDSSCARYRRCIERMEAGCEQTVYAELCHAYFANPGQADSNRNGRGDRCERRLQARIETFEPSRSASTSKGEAVGWSGLTYDVGIVLEGGWPVGEGAAPHVDWQPTMQRVSVSACGCPADASKEECFELYCPRDSETDLHGNLAWEPIYAPEASLLPNVGSPGHCEKCPDRLDPREPGSTAPAYAANKHVGFSHDPMSNGLFFTWEWARYGQLSGKQGLAGKVTWVRVAWQDPHLDSCSHHLKPEEHLVFSEPIIMTARGCRGAKIPWRLTPDGRPTVLTPKVGPVTRSPLWDPVPYGHVPYEHVPYERSRGTIERDLTLEEIFHAYGIYDLYALLGLCAHEPRQTRDMPTGR
jgi:hypothetical protein